MRNRETIELWPRNIVIVQNHNNKRFPVFRFQPCCQTLNCSFLGSVSFPDRSALDPVDRFPVQRVIKATYMDYDIKLPAGRVIARL